IPAPNDSPCIPITHSFLTLSESAPVTCEDYEAGFTPTVDCNDLLLTKLPLPIPENTHTLRLQSNLLSGLDTAVLHGLPNLTDLDENHLSHLPEDSFLSLPALQELFLSHNNLHSIAPGAFTGLDSLLRLHINNNRLTTVDPQWFKALPRLEVLMLGGNPVEALPERGFIALKSLRSLEVSLHSNPLRCDCLFHWAAKETAHPHIEKTIQTETQTARVVRFIQPQATLCSEPPELRARRVRDVTSGEMSASCLPMIPVSSLPSYVGVREGGKLVLHCRALADPPPELYWVTPSGLKLSPPSKGSPVPTSCKSLTSEGINHTSASSAPDDTACQPFKHYQVLPEGTLEISKITPREAGLYTCVAENALGADTRSVTVGVHDRIKKGRGVRLLI
uniref:Leucine rich repeat neuronal 2 n=1 Tax=Amphiprion percula TaxID=161767 RepID=A0A3P8SDN0_AMPPE